jgi:uncharacterized damage-inducible protein DinB
MPTDAQQFALVIERIARDISAQLRGVSDETLNTLTPIPDTNTLFALGTHTVGMGEFWVLALVGGRPIPRDRSSEFRAHGAGTELVTRFEKWIVDVHDLLDDLPDSMLNQIAEPPAEFRTTGNLGDDRPLSARDCLLHVIEHSATHLGHIQLTLQMFAAIQQGLLTSAKGD